MYFGPAFASILAFDFVVRIVFYGLVFSFAQHLIYPFGIVHEEVNLILNAFYALSSVASILVSRHADRARDGLYTVLKTGTCFFAISVAIIWISTLSEYTIASKEVTISREWLRHINRGPFALFLTGMLLFAVSYGSIKTTISPIIGNLHQLYEDTRNEHDSWQNGMSSQTKSFFSHSNRYNLGQMSIDQLFRLYYWLINLGGLIGILLVPMFTEPIGVHFTSISTDNMQRIGDNPLTVDIEQSFIENAHHKAIFIRSFLEPYALCMILSFFALTIMFLNMMLRCRRRPVLEVSKTDGSTSISPIISDDRSSSHQEEDSYQSFFGYLLNPNVLKISCMLPVFWLISNQQSSNIILQAHYLQRPEWMASPTMLNAINSILLLIIIPCLECVFFAHRRLSDWFTVKRRCVFGLGLSSVSMGYAAVLQICILRRGYFDAHSNYHPYGEKVSIFYQVPIYFIQTVAEAFTSITVLQLAYTLSPKSKKAFGMALYMFTSFVASMLGILVTPLTSPGRIIFLFSSCALIISVESVLFYRFFPEK